jgi:hypothetical protein
MGLIDSLANAIATAEGFFVNGSLPQRNNNPGDLRAAPWLTNPILSNGFWTAATLGAGIAGLQHQLALDIARGWTLKQLIYAWAPPTDNNKTDVYLSETVRRLAQQGIVVNVDVPLQNYLKIIQIP